MRISHIAWNLAGLAVPLVVAVVTVPHIVTNLGPERFGLLALAWGLIGYAGALDLGIGRALNQMISKMRGNDQTSSIPSAVLTASLITLITGLAGAILISTVGNLASQRWIHLNGVSDREIRNSLFLLAIALPAQAMSATYRGVNESFLNFKGISILRVILGTINFGGPYLVSLLTISMPPLILTLVASRLAALLIYRLLAIQCLSKAGLETGAVYSRDISKNLFAFGGWITVSSIASPILVQADRFVIAATVSAAAVTVYVLPYEMVVQTQIMATAVTSVIFPGLTALMYKKPNEWKPYFYKWLQRLAIVMAITTASIFLLIPFILPTWLGQNFNPTSITVGRILCLGVFANAVGSMFFAVIHAKGRADITAKLHLVEIPLFLTALTILIAEFGVIGAAWAWSGRMTFDCVALACCAKLKDD